MNNRGVGTLVVLFAFLFSSACVAKCKPLKGQTLPEVDTQISGLEQDALAEYLFGRPEASIKKLSKLIEVYGATNCTTVVSEPIRQGYQYEIVLVRARLARQYEKLGDKVSAQQETDRALKLGRALVPGGAWSPDDLSELIERSDANIRDQLRRSPDAPH